MKRSTYLVAALAIFGASLPFIAQAQQAPATPGAAPAAAPGGGGLPPGVAARGGLGGGRGLGAGRGAPPGPPAPVPPEVAMSRPTVDEVNQMNAELKRLLDSDNSPTKALFQKYQSFVGTSLTIAPPRDNPCIRPTGGGVRAGRHDAFVERAKQGGIDLLFEGDSITDWWQQNPPNGGSAMLKKYFGDYKVADFAVAGDTTQGVLWGLQNGEGTGFQPKAIMLMIGTNNAGNCSAAEIAEGIGSIILENRKDFPNAKILLLAIFPRGNPNDPVRAKLADINKTVAKLDDKQHVFYMDIGPKFLDPASGAFLPEAFRPDNLHPMEKGYDIWGEAVKDKLAELMK